jgi:hypothetical protein
MRSRVGDGAERSPDREAGGTREGSVRSGCDGRGSKVVGASDAATLSQDDFPCGLEMPNTILKRGHLAPEAIDRAICAGEVFLRRLWSIMV